MRLAGHAVIPGAGKPRIGSRRALVGLAALLIALGIAARWLDLPAAFGATLAWTQGLGPWGGAIFIAIYALATVFLLPAFLLTLGAGAVYGVVYGALLVSIGATLGATGAFLAGRYLARDWVAQRIAGDARFTALDDAVAREGWKIVGLTRLSPAIPFVIQNYAYGLTRISLREYVLASWIGMTPGILMYVYLGSLAGDLASLGTSGRARTPAEWALYAIGLLATVTVTVSVTRLARRALRQRIPTMPDGQPVEQSIGGAQVS
ncbi:MAG TPA: TVP38/TMEM64 family protein [Candidatus Methylomirabilis sp.]|nr:TVP38/TMEM64 family protein [Candidatus Methylomirabilis sp.]